MQKVRDVIIRAYTGYVGYEKGGELTNAVKEKPFCVLLFDEIEKAHGRIMDKFLQILEDGRLTDGKGETVYFIDEVKKHFVEELKRPEILNRIG